MTEVFDAINNRIKNPIFGYFILAFVAYNWKVLFYLFTSNTDTINKFKYFDDNTNSQTLLIYPVIVGVIGAIIYPWISLLFVWIIRRPVEHKQIIHLTSKNKLLIKEKEFEEARAKLLAVKEKELISRAQRDEEINSLSDEKLRTELQIQIEELREQLNSKNPQQISNTNSSYQPSKAEILMELGRLHEKMGDVQAAKKYFEEAAYRAE